MNYLELINKCLTELNYKEVNSFSELVKNDHKKIKNILNLINSEICRFDSWNFLLRKTSFTLPRNTGEVENNVNGRIAMLLVDGVKYEFFQDFQKFLTNTQPPCTYSVFNDKFLFPIFNTDKTIEVAYYTSNCAKDSQDNEKLNLTEASDETLIPETFAEPILVYGTCARLKGNPQHIRFSYWISMYNNALANLRAKNSVKADLTPNVKLFRY